jgi:quercetin dioxygenase-like cupin family protein
MRPFLATLVVLAGLVLLPVPAPCHAQDDATAGTEGSKLKLESLLKTVLEGVEGTEVIVSRVTMPPHSTLPRHWHPGEEFAYVLEGTVTLWQKGKEDIVAHAGDAVGIALKQVHTAITHEEGATILVFRVHEQGQPERVLVEDED